MVDLWVSASLLYPIKVFGALAPLRELCGLDFLKGSAISVSEDIYELPEDPIEGTTGKIPKYAVTFGGKENKPKYPYSVPNELVAGFIGQCLGLDVLLSIPFRSSDGREISLVQWDETINAMAVPSAEVEEFVKKYPLKVHGAIIFDLFTANNDRAFGPNCRNLRVDRAGRLQLFDQGNSCFYRNSGAYGSRPAIVAGIPRLDAVEGDLIAMNDQSHLGGYYFQLLNEWGHVEHWCEQIRALPDFLLESAVARIPDDFQRPTKPERQRLIEFLCRRKHCLIDDIRKSQAVMFPDLPPRT